MGMINKGVCTFDAVTITLNRTNIDLTEFFSSEVNISGTSPISYNFTYSTSETTVECKIIAMAPYDYAMYIGAVGATTGEVSLLVPQLLTITLEAANYHTYFPTFEMFVLQENP